MEDRKLKLVLVNIWHFPAQTPHFGLISLAAYIRENNPNVEVKIVEGMSPIKEIIDLNPDLIGFTSDTLVYKKTIQKAKQLRKRIKAPFILGGVHITALPESLHSIFELAVLSEGELIIMDVLASFKRNGFSKNALKNISGIAYYNKNKLINTGRRELIRDINTLPFPARDLVPMEEYYFKDQLYLFGIKKMATIMTSRGCPYQCIFCGSPAQWGRVRFHSPEHVVAEIKFLLERYEIDAIMFWDDLFTAPEERIKKIVQLIKKEGLDKKLTFFGYARANLINRRICNLLREMNVKRLIFGLESGSDKILNYLKQNSVTVADNKRAVSLCREYGITTSSGFITGTPGETLDDLKKTYEFMRKYPLDNTQVYILTPYPGTKIWHLAEEKGLVSKEMDFSKLFVQLPSPAPLDFLRKEDPLLLKNRIFLNTDFQKNKEYLRLIFKMQKLALFQNFLFYFKVIFKDRGLLIRILKSKWRVILGKIKSSKAVLTEKG